MKDMAPYPESRTVFRFALPMVLVAVFQQLYAVVDGFVVGNYVGKQALAAVGQSFSVVFVSLAFAAGISLAANILVPHFVRSQEKELMQAVIDTLFFITKYAAIAVTIIGFVAAPVILRLMQTPVDVMPDAVMYLRIIFLGTLASFGYATVSSIARGSGDAKTPLYALVVPAVANVALDILFVVVLGWGVAGAAAATVIAQGASFAWSLIHLVSHNPDLRFRFFSSRFDRAIVHKISAIGLPAVAQQFLAGTGLMAITGLVNGFGTDPAAAYSVACRFDGFVILPAMNISFAIAALTGANIAAGRKDLAASQGLFRGAIMAFAISLPVALVMFFFGKGLMLFFSPDAEVIRIGSGYLKIVPLCYALQAVLLCFMGAIRGAGRILVSLSLTVVAVWLVRVPCAVVFSRFRGTSGIWWAIVAGSAVGMAGSVLCYFFGRKVRAVDAAVPAVSPPDSSSISV